MPNPRLSVDAVLKMAHEEARRHAGMSLAERDASPALLHVIGQLWGLARQRLGHSRELQELDEMIARITGVPVEGPETQGR